MATTDIVFDERYETVEGHLERDRDTVIGLWRGHVGWQDQLERMYDVFYLNCPFGRPRLRLLRHRASGDIVGTIGAGPRPMLLRGREARVGVISHFTVLPKHRSLRPAMELARAMTRASLDQFEFVYGMTNARGNAVCRRAGFAVPGELLRHVKPLRYRSYIPRLMPGPCGRFGGLMLDGVLAASRRIHLPGKRPSLHVAWTDTIDPRMQALWEQSEHGDCLSTVRTTEMLRWRFLGLPAIRRRFLLVAPAVGRPLLAWFACETNVRSPEFMTVTDAWFEGGVCDADRRAIRELSRKGYEAGYEAIEIRLTATAAVLDAWRAEGFVTRGKQPVFTFGTDLQPQGEVAPRIHFTDIEQDG